MLTPARLDAQDDGPAPTDLHGGWVLALGLARQGISDELVSPLQYRGTGVLVGVGYESLAERRVWVVRASYTGPRMGSTRETARGGFEETRQAGLELGWLAKVTALADGRIGLYLGGALDVRSSYRSHHYDVHEFGTRTEAFGDLLAPLQASGMWILRVGDHGRLSHRLSIPALGLVVRSPWTGLKYTPDVRLAVPTRLTGFDSELTFGTVLADRWRLGVFHRVTLLKYPDPLPLAWAIHHVGVRLGVAP